MENTTRMLQRHTAVLADHHLLIVEADDVALADLPAASLQLHSDDTSLPGRQSGWLPEMADNTDLVIIILPKSRERLRLVLACLAGQISQPVTVWLVGPTTGGVKGRSEERRVGKEGRSRCAAA